MPTLEDNSAIKGEIGYFGLSEWWLSEFSNEERNHIVCTYRPMGSTGDILIKGEIEWSSSSVVHLLYNMAGWFNNKNDRYLAIKILNKAEELVSDEIPIIDLHFLYQQMMQAHYSNRKIDPTSLDKSKMASKKQVEIAPKVAKAFKEQNSNFYFPTHEGYTDLVATKEEEENYQEVIDICLKIIEEGWNGDWKVRMERCRNKLNS